MSVMLRPLAQRVYHMYVRWEFEGGGRRRDACARYHCSSVRRARLANARDSALFLQLSASVVGNRPWRPALLYRSSWIYVQNELSYT